MNKLLKLNDNDGSFKGTTHSITRSTGQSLTIEATALTVLAMLKTERKNQAALNNAVEYIVSSRSGYGGFGSTQGTILALKALTEYARHSKQTDEAGTIECYVDGKRVATQKYEAGQRDAITIEGLGKYIDEGIHKIKVKYVGVKNPMPYTLAINYYTSMPATSAQCLVDLSVSFSQKTVKVGETVRLTTTLSNTTGQGQPMTMAIAGIPAGLSAQPWQLKELQEKEKIDFYEIRDNYVFFYYRDLAPNEQHSIHLDLKAELPGQFETPASSAYLYYTNEHKRWASAGSIVVNQ